MKRSKERGEMLEPMLILIALISILVFFVLPKAGVDGPGKKFFEVADSVKEYEYTSGSDRTRELSTNSAYNRNVTLSVGNAKYSYNPIEEYVTITNNSNAPVNITGWRLENDRANRVYPAGNQYVTYPSEEAIIPRAVGYINPLGLNIAQDVILKPGEQAIVTTGSTIIKDPYQIVSFKENKCSGYLEEGDYTFAPSLSLQCTRPSDEPGVNKFDRECRDFISQINSCHSPNFKDRDRTIDGREINLSSACIAFIKEKYNYAGCIASHRNDADFYKSTWRVYLGRQWELWAEEDEEIKLYDQFGKLVDYASY